MTGPNPDAELDAALGVTQLPPAAVTDAHDAQARDAIAQTRASIVLGNDDYEELRRYVRQAIADAEQRGAARVLAEHGLAGA